MHEPTRQIHLDFHTSGLIEGVGARFSRIQFQEALTLGRVQLVNVFAKCHHGYSYYPTKVGRPHPHLACDLLGGQIEACHEIGVRAPIYYTMGWSALDAEEHPGWCMRREDGSVLATQWDPTAGPEDPKPGYSWQFLCPSGEYHELMMAQTEELCRTYPVDGFWYDIYLAGEMCHCERCRRRMAGEGGSPREARAATIREHASALRALILAHHPEFAAERQKAGDLYTWYICCGPKTPFIANFIDRPATDLRVWLWQTWQGHVDGVLIWDTVWWTSGAAYPDSLQNPYEDSMSWVDGYGTPRGAKQAWNAGDGRFLYPPEACFDGGDGPVLDPPATTIRWEALRDGMEDFEYLAMLKRLLAAKRGQLSTEQINAYEHLLSVPEGIARSLTSYTRAPAPIETRRGEIAQAIEELSPL